jgi:hypothetical protein
MKRIAAIALLAAASFVTAGSAMAQENVVRVTIPFNFAVNGNSLPAGSYSIVSGGTSLLTLRDREHGANLIALSTPSHDDTIKDNVLVFHRYGDQYFLSRIRAEGSSMNVYFPVSKREKWASAQKQEVAARENHDVTVAMK